MFHIIEVKRDNIYVMDVNIAALEYKTGDKVRFISN